MCNKIVLAAAFGPSVILIAWALWINFTTDDQPASPYDEDYWATMLDEGDWGRQ